MRYLAVIALISLLVGCGAANTTFRLDDSVFIGNSSGLPRGGLVRINPNSVRSFSPIIANETGQRLVITDVQVVGPSDPLMHQVYARFHRWNPPTCEGPHSGLGCGMYAIPRSAFTAPPFTVGPHQEVSVGLKLRFGSCSELASGDAVPISGVRITYRQPDGKTETNTVSLGAGEIHLHVPTAANCFDPHSSISVTSPSGYRSSSEHALPSAGDVCQLQNGQFKFDSRKLRIDGPSRWERVTVRIDHFHGATGTYTNGTVGVVAAGKKISRWHPVAVKVTTVNDQEVIAEFQAGRGHTDTAGGTIRCRVTVR
ncbi:MAG: hypothetical protein QOG85_1604 [Gaiellaceae bacterium]|nr:hypothetical protein [Gaiellaceae bacterium]